MKDEFNLKQQVTKELTLKIVGLVLFIVTLLFTVLLTASCNRRYLIDEQNNKYIWVHEQHSEKQEKCFVSYISNDKVVCKVFPIKDNFTYKCSLELKGKNRVYDFYKKCFIFNF